LTNINEENTHFTRRKGSAKKRANLLKNESKFTLKIGGDKSPPVYT